MKKFFLALICLFLCQLSFAGHITTEEAQHKALLFVKSHRAASQRQGMRLAARGNAIAISQTDSLTSYYVFNIGEQNGFVVISGDDRVPAILGYADEGEFDYATMPENFKAWVDGVASSGTFIKAASMSSWSTGINGIPTNWTVQDVTV